MLRLEGLSCGHGLMRAVDALDFAAEGGRIAALLGANGAGKSSTIQCIAGHVKVFEGRVVYDETAINDWTPMKRVGAGIALVPEGRRLFSSLTVRENLVAGGYCRDKSAVRDGMEQVFEMFPRLGERIHQRAGSLSGGEQQMLAIGRALMSRPKLLLLDEPSLGLAPLIVQKIFEIINEINRNDGTTILLVEQNANIALQTAQRGYVLETGTIIMEDDASHLLTNPEIRKAYLGES